MSAFEQLLATLPRTTLVVGKGGVGKTTCAVGIAALFARRGESTLLLSTDPAAALGEVIGASVTTDALPVLGQSHLAARQLSASQLRAEFLGRWRDTIADIIDRGTYLDRDDVDGLVDAALPGVDEVFALLALAEVIADDTSAYQRIVVDTAPTGHTLRLLALPDTFRALLSMLDLMQDKHRFMVRALTHRYRRDRADDFIDDMRKRIDRLRATLADDSMLAAIVVARDEPMVVAETMRYIASLRDLHVRIATVVDNFAVNDPGESFEGVSTIRLALLREPPRGIDAVAHAVTSDARAFRKLKPRTGDTAIRRTPIATLVRRLTIVGGKGGVGKSTVACALALAVVDAEADAARTLLVSTDPAPSLADALGDAAAKWAHTDMEHDVAEVPGLTVRQMDAGAAFARVRTDYQGRIDSIFEALVGGGVNIEQDRAIVRDLFTLAPPGIDELFALSMLGDALADGRFARIIVDPAPTGHLLRLLEMPAIALDWSHRLMRLMLKYREVVGLGDAAGELLAFAKRTRALDTLLHDAAESCLVIVSLDEPVVRAETERLAAAVRERAIDVSAIVWNRVRAAVLPLPPTVVAQQLFALEASPPPIGVAALRTWSRSWRELPLDS